MKAESRSIVFVSETFEPVCGWGTVARSLATEASRSGWNVICIASDNSGSPNTPALFSVHDPLLRKIRLACRFWLWVWFRAPRQSPVHIITEPHAWLAVGLFGVSVTATLHGTYANPQAHGGLFAPQLFRLGMRRATHVVAVSNLTARIAKESGGTDACVIQNGIDARITVLPRAAIAFASDATFRFLSVGGRKPRKGFLELIHGFARFHERHPSSVLAIVGDESSPNYTTQLREAITTYGLMNCVQLVGKVTDMELRGWYAWSTVFALTPQSGLAFEGFGLVYLEANAFGKPVVGVVGTGGEDAIRPGETGILVASLMPEAICQGLEDATNIPDSFFAEWVNVHAWSTVFTKYERLYRSA